MYDSNEMLIREFKDGDIPAIIDIWNEVVTDGIAFPQTETLDTDTGREFFAGQSFTGVLEWQGEILGLYILHPNNIGRCGHLANASYAVKSSVRGKKIGEKLVCHSLDKGRELGFKVLQFNAVVKTNTAAAHLYEKLGFVKLGVVPGGFRLNDNTYEDIILYYHTL